MRNTNFSNIDINSKYGDNVINTNKGDLYYTIGTSHSGKSTFCNKWVKFFGDPIDCSSILYRPRVIACADDIRKSLYNKRYNSHAEPMIFAMKQYYIKSLLTRGHDVIVDGTHTTRDSIKRMLEIDENAYGYIFNVPLEVCLSRINFTKQTDMVPVITRHYKQIQGLIKEGLENIRLELLEEIRIRWDKPKIV